MRILKGKRCFLRALEPTDIDFLYELENTESLWEVSDSQTPFSKYILQRFLANSDKDIYETKQLRLIISLNDHPVCGCIDLFEFDPKNKKVGVGIVVLEKYQNQKIGTEALQLVCQYAFDYLNVHQLFAHISEDNIPSIQLFERENFEHTGTLKDWIFHKNRYKNVRVYQKMIQKCI